MGSTIEIIHVVHAIQQAVAPVFLLAGVRAILSVLSIRLARIIDRYRDLEEGGDEKRIMRCSWPERPLQ